MASTRMRSWLNFGPRCSGATASTAKTDASSRSDCAASELAPFRDWLEVKTVVDQGDGDLGLRLARAAEALPVLLLGADIPGLTPEHLISAAEALGKAPAVIGPAPDGGYWLLGLARAVPGVFDGIAWGTSTVLAATLARLPGDTVQLPMLSDLDTPDDLLRWPGI